MTLKLKIWWHKKILKWKYKRYLSTRNTYNCGDTLFFASRPDMKELWDRLVVYRKYVIELIKQAEGEASDDEVEEKEEGTEAV